MAKKIKICHVIGSFVNGGVEAVILNYFSHMDLNEYEVHIIGHGILVQECADKFANMGFIIHNVTPKSVSVLKNLKEIEEIFKNIKKNEKSTCIFCAGIAKEVSICRWISNIGAKPALYPTPSENRRSVGPVHEHGKEGSMKTMDQKEFARENVFGLGGREHGLCQAFHRAVVSEPADKSGKRTFPGKCHL